jgi:hypothetical protein
MTTDQASLVAPAIALAGFLLSLLLETLVRPSAPGLRRPWFSLAVHGGLWVVAWACCFAVLGRPIFAALIVLCGQFLVIQVSNAKYRALREPFIFSDFGIFSQALKHPRLYFPFLGIGRAALAALAVVLAAAVGLWLENPVGHAWLAAGWSTSAALVLLGLGLAAAPKALLDPEKDLAQRGLFCSIAQYWLKEHTSKLPYAPGFPAIAKTSAELPDVVVVQSESFFDARRICRGIRRDVLRNFDEACSAASMHGRLSVPAWGANTMRPEFSFLTGTDPESLGVHRFNPYRRVTRRPFNALPTSLQALGYRTTCIHPHPARFFRRDRAFPNLGFSRFLDDREFRGAKTEGPYVSDEAVTDKLVNELGSARDPAFFFVITMENHGPLHLESVPPQDTDEFYTEQPPEGCADLTVYLRHLRNADRELGRLRSFLHSRIRPAVLCFYGEHLPSMPAVYDSLGMPDGKTDYFIETTAGANRVECDLSIQELAQRMVGTMGRAKIL